MTKLQDDNLSDILQFHMPASSGLHDYGTHLLAGEINTDSAREVIEFILSANLDKESKFSHLNLIINSPGGTFEDGFAVIDVMLGSKVSIHTVGIGSICSMGLLVFIAGKKGKRTLTPNTLIMSHQWSGMVGGKEHELVASQKEHGLISSMVMRHLKKHTGMKEKNIRKHLLPPSDVWLDAHQAKELGICDIVKNI